MFNRSAELRWTERKCFQNSKKQLSLSLFGWKDEDIENIHIRGKVSAEKNRNSEKADNYKK